MVIFALQMCFKLYICTFFTHTFDSLNTNPTPFWYLIIIVSEKHISLNVSYWPSKEYPHRIWFQRRISFKYVSCWVLCLNCPAVPVNNLQIYNHHKNENFVKDHTMIIHVQFRYYSASSSEKKIFLYRVLSYFCAKLCLSCGGGHLGFSLDK